MLLASQYEHDDPVGHFKFGQLCTKIRQLERTYHRRDRG